MSIRWTSLAVAVLAGILALVQFLRRPPDTGTRGLVRAEMKTVGVAGGAPPVGVVILSPVGTKLVVPLFVTAGEAGILGERQSSGAEAAGLPKAALSALGGRLTGVVVEGAVDPTARAEIVGPRGKRSVKAPVAEALEWAESAGVPIWLTPQLVAKRGLEQRQLDALAPGLGGSAPAAPVPKESPTL